MSSLFLNTCFFVILFIFPCLAHAKRVALVIGNATYVNEARLRNPVNDAQLIKSTLEGETLQFNEVKFVKDGSRLEMLQALAQFKALSAGADVAVIYYSGHGMIDSKRSNYVLPIDMPKTSSNAGLSIDTALEYGGIHEDKLVDAVEKARVQVVIIDACRDNGFATTKSGTKGLSRRVDQARNRLIAYATEEGRVAEDGVGSNSAYAISLAENLIKLEWPILRIFDQVATDVENATKRMQSPTRTGNLRTDVYFREPPPRIPANTEVAIVAPVPVIVPSEEDVLWDSVQRKHNRQEILDFLRLYPNSKHANTAKLLLDALDVAAKDELVATETRRWDLALSSNSIAGYESYIQDYPKGRYVLQAKRALYEAKDSSVWSGLNQGDIDSLHGYIRQFPDGRWVVTARQLITGLEKQMQLSLETSIWAKATTKEAILLYIQRYPSGIFSEQARTRLREIDFQAEVMSKPPNQANVPPPAPNSAGNDAIVKPKPVGVVVTF